MWYMRTFYQMLLRDLKDDGDSAVQQVHILCAAAATKQRVWGLPASLHAIQHHFHVMSFISRWTGSWQLHVLLSKEEYPGGNSQAQLPFQLRQALITFTRHCLTSQSPWGAAGRVAGHDRPDRERKKKVISYLKYPTDSAPLAAPPAPDRLCSFQIPWARRSGEQLATWCH